MNQTLCQMGENLQTIRKFLDLSQEDLGFIFGVYTGKPLGVTRKTISNWENGVVDPPMTLVSFLKELGINPNFLAGADTQILLNTDKTSVLQKIKILQGR